MKTENLNNPFTKHKKRRFFDFFKRVVINRIKGGKSDKPYSNNSKKTINNGSFLRDNRSEFTVTWVGHSTLLIQIEGKNVLTDPVWSKRVSPPGFIGPRRHAEPGIRIERLPRIDFVVISHNHYDHLDKNTIEKLGNKPQYLVPFGTGKILKSLDIDNYFELNWDDTVEIEGIKFICTQTQHFSGRGLFDMNKSLWCGWVIKGRIRSFFFAGDTGKFPEIKNIGDIYGPFDAAALPIGAYKPRWFMAPMHLSPQEAVEVFLSLNADIFVPIHWGTFKLSCEPLNDPPITLENEIKERNLPKEKFWILKHGETRIIKSSYLSEK